MFSAKGLKVKISIIRKKHPKEVYCLPFVSFIVPDLKRYSAKLLLFGEHVLLVGAPALAVPMDTFGGYWAWASPSTDQALQRSLRDFAAYLNTQGGFSSQFSKDLDAGLYFRSDIPEGYGLGSSGALCAAVYDRYALEKTGDLSALKAIFSEMECFFHGNSSGIDPLTVYAACPLLIEKKQYVKRVQPPTWEGSMPSILLVDSRLPRQTEPLVSWFLQQYEATAFREQLDAQLLPAHHHALNAWLEGNPKTFWPALRQLSQAQYEMLSPMIPTTLSNFWLESLTQEDYALKICGAGGGGFVLAFAKTPTAAAALKLQLAQQGHPSTLWTPPNP